MIMKQDRSLIPACDVDAATYEALLKATADIDGVGGYKLGFMLGLSLGLPRAVEIARKYTTKPLIYDHQKAGTDIPDTGKGFARVCKRSGIDAVILFPQAGPETERAWINACRDEGLGVIVGGLMTHKGYTRGDGGWIADEAVIEMYLTAAREKVTDFVVPGTNPEAISKIRHMLESGGTIPTFYAPGFGAQGGEIRMAADAAGPNFHAIVGRALVEASDMKAAATLMAQQLKG
ncbi:MAG: orotidine 5'-phosphate decarboxylase [Deltaproteobacteria bacterium]|nr:orotidine 5'-phosphate decarboxylase [Deltaproteobacteria bacterium]